MKKKLKPSRPARRPASKYPPERLRWLNQQLAEVAAGCPWTKRNPPECPLCNVRKLSATQVAAWLDGLKPEEKEYLVLYHQCCLAIKWENAMAETAPR